MLIQVQKMVLIDRLVLIYKLVWIQQPMLIQVQKMVLIDRLVLIFKLVWIQQPMLIQVQKMVLIDRLVLIYKLVWIQQPMLIQVQKMVLIDRLVLIFKLVWIQQPMLIQVQKMTGPDFQAGVDPAADADPSSENGVNRSTGPDFQAGVDPAADADPGATTGVKCGCLCCRGVCREGREVGRRREVERMPHSFRSVMDLKKKGIRFKSSSSQSFSDVKFEPGLFSAQLQLPRKFVSIHTKIFFLNMIAYELSPNNVTNYVVISYINFMKSLTESKEDVAELRKRKILYNVLGSDEQVLEVFRDINTYRDANPRIFRDVKDKIEAHYNSRVKKWIGEARHVHFRNPRTVIAWLAAISLIAIAAASLYYSERRESNK
ncbi:UNVERIFIED_CONTAM: hypothetical protein Slati_0946800 [Sesamum latifolium]|uniref:Uncharacterized protein n=1 Tax=Sesamum latifolium TaxID=2727402 RepID=A0AAW2XTM0_9LAMI